MSLAGMDGLRRVEKLVGLAALLFVLGMAMGCGGALSANQAGGGDPLHLGVTPGPLGSTTPQTIQVRLGSEPSDRIVSLSLAISSLQATNSGNQNLDLLTAPMNVELTRSAVVTEPIVIRSIYQDTYSALIFPAMTGSVVFYDSTGVLTTQSISIPTQTIPYTFVLGTNPMVLSLSLDIAQTFTITDPIPRNRRGQGTIKPYASGSYITVNPIVLNSQNAVPNPNSIQPEAGSIMFNVGTVNSVDTVNKLITIQPSSGDALQFSYGNGTQFVNCDPTMLTNMMIETEAATQADGSVLASQVQLIDNSASGSELYGLLSGYAPEGVYYNLVDEGGAGVNFSSSLVGENISADWLNASYSVNSTNLDLTNSQDLIFDESHVFPGQMVELYLDSLTVPDPESSNAGYMQPGMFELEQQTISGTVSNYTYDNGTQSGTFTLTVASNSPLLNMNPGLVSVTVRQIPQTYLRNLSAVSTGAVVKVRGLLFSNPNYTNDNYQPGPSSPIAFIMVASRISN